MYNSIILPRKKNNNDKERKSLLGRISPVLGEAVHLLVVIQLHFQLVVQTVTAVTAQNAAIDKDSTSVKYQHSFSGCGLVYFARTSSTART